MTRFCCFVSMLLLFTVAVGCGSSKYDLVPITGTVTLDGKPLEGASVKFQPQGGGTMSYGVTDAEGRYKLNTINDESGVMVATHTVSIFKTSGTVDASTEESPSNIKQLVPERYNYKSELVYEVKAGEKKPADFALSSK